eukprot:scaffold240141_cov20-Prasinocladus_malaysianus.AAC.1
MPKSSSACKTKSPKLTPCTRVRVQGHSTPSATTEGDYSLLKSGALENWYNICAPGERQCCYEGSLYDAYRSLMALAKLPGS